MKDFKVMAEKKQVLRVGVLMGGRSIEREVSHNSGRTVCDHLDVHQYAVVPLFQTQEGILYRMPWHFLHRGKTTDFQHRLEHEAERVSWDDLKNIIDFMYIATHGRYGEDGILQGVLELFGIPYLGSGVLASALRMDKHAHKIVLQKKGILVPKWVIFYPHEISTFSEQQCVQRCVDAGITFPCVVKPCMEGSSLGITVVYDAHNFVAALQHACFIDQRKGQKVVVEDKIEGTEFTCITLFDAEKNGYISLPPTEIVPVAGKDFFDYEQKYMPGKAIKHTPIRCSADIIEKVQKTCIRVMEILDFCTMSRIDGFVATHGDIVIIDPNTLSGMDPASFLFCQAALVDMSHTRVINHLIETELCNYALLAQKTSEEKRGKDMKKMRIAVLFGGRSHEKEISLESGRNVVYKLSPYRHEPISLFVSSNLELYHISQALLVRNSTREIENLVEDSMKVRWSDLPSMADFTFIALHGGEGENGVVQGMLEMLDMPYNGSGVFASALCMNKYKTNEFLASQGFAVPRNCFIPQQEWRERKNEMVAHIIDTLPFPVIVKPHDDGCSVMVQKATTSDELIAAGDCICDSGKEGVFVEEYMRGMELTVGVIGNEKAHALVPSEVIAQGGVLTIEEKFLPGAGENQTPARLTPDVITFIQHEIERIYEAVGCAGYARIDCFYQTAQESVTGQQRVVVLEINTLPGLTPATCLFHQAAEAGMRPMEFIDRIIELGFQHHRTIDSIKETAQKENLSQLVQ
ncbi:MAG TPA: ATP-grasp domain-containing protein [Candidatus Bathyarchaeia archaeon]|nr:ATP-grasp domain-containing protein [Candidatus Bathyarchaeia archaeon]